MSSGQRSFRPRVDLVRLPARPRAPLAAVGRRIGFALGLLVFIAVVVLIGRNGYTDTAGGTLGVIDALYYASVTVTTTGYGDISAVTTSTRLAALLLITPARILFLILVVGTTVEVLTERSRTLLQTQHWRRTVNHHHLICGYGSTGRAAARALIAQGVAQSDVAVVDVDDDALADATAAGFTAIRGDASKVAVLQQAAIDRAVSVVVTPNRDDTAVLITLTARELNPSARVVATVRERENMHLLRQSGADSAIDQAASVGRLVGIATRTPGALDLIDDLLDVGTDLQIVEVTPELRDGVLVAPSGVRVIEVLRDGRRLAFDDPAVGKFQADDRLMAVSSARS
jgi:voltage-gated potassium channel